LTALARDPLQSAAVRALKPFLVAALQLMWILAGLVPPGHVHPHLSLPDAALVHHHLGWHHEHAEDAGHVEDTSEAVSATDHDDHAHVLTLDTLVATRTGKLQLPPPAVVPRLPSAGAIDLASIGDVPLQPPTPTSSPPRSCTNPRAPPA
jgi:hypothetical protein